MPSKSSADQQPGQPSTELTLEQLPNGEHAWLRPRPARRYVMPSRYRLTDQGRRAIAEGNQCDASASVTTAGLSASGQLIAAAEALLEVVDHLPIRAAALAQNLDLYERAAAVKDAIAACQGETAASS